VEIINKAMKNSIEKEQRHGLSRLASAQQINLYIYTALTIV